MSDPTTTPEHHAGCDIKEHTGTACTCGAVPTTTRAERTAEPRRLRYLPASATIELVGLTLPRELRALAEHINGIVMAETERLRGEGMLPAAAYREARWRCRPGLDDLNARIALWASLRAPAVPELPLNEDGTVFGGGDGWG